MSRKTIAIIFRKELLDTLRDRKTLLFMVALPVLFMPALLSLLTRVTESEAKKSRERRLVVQAEPNERDRLCAFLRGRLARHADASTALLSFFGPRVTGMVEAIAQDLSIPSIEVLFGLPFEPRIAQHPRAAELKAELAAAQQQARDQVRALLGGDEEAAPVPGQPPPKMSPAEARQAIQLMDLLRPLVTFDFVTAEEAAQRPVEHAAAPIDSLPNAVRSRPERAAAATAISERRIHAFVSVPRGLDDGIIERDDSVEVELVYDSTLDLSAEAGRRIEAALSAARELAVVERLDRDGVPASFVAPVRVASVNAAPRSKEVLKFVASILPYLLILMCFLGGLYPATDLGAGEKERLTLETLLVSPASRLEIAIGKFGVVFLSSMVAGLLSTASIAWTFTSGLASAELSRVLHLDLDWRTSLISLALIAPLAAVFASLMLALSIYAKSQKEAQSLMMPLQFLIIVPAMLSMIPTIELDLRFAWVPVINVALGLRTVLTAGGAPLPWLELTIILVSTSLFAAAALAWCARRFSREQVIFRS